MLNIFCSDSAFNITNTGTVIAYGDDVNKFGLVNSKILNYFYKPSSIRDDRSAFLGDNHRNAFAMFGSNNDRPYGQMEIFFDNNLELPEGVMGTNITKDEDYCINHISKNATQKNALFAIIEHLFLFHTDDLGLPNITTLNENLVNSSILFGGYVDGSLKVSASNTESQFIMSSKNITAKCNFYDWVEFSFYVDSSHTVDIRVWLSSEKFLEEYPNCIMTKMISPCDPQLLFTMTHSNIIEAISDSAAYSGDISSNEITKEDHTGMFVFKTRYINQTTFSNYVMPFEIFFKGKEPTTDQQRTFVRTTLETMYPSINTLLWKEILPDLFIEGSYFLMPYYTNRKELSSTESTTYVDIGTCNVKAVMNKVYDLYPNYDTEFLDAHCVLCNIAGSGLQVVAFPEQSNIDTHYDLLAEHPSYIAIDATNEQFMHMTTVTQKFAEYLSLGLKIAMGLTAIPKGTGFVQTQVNGRFYIMFALNGLEYYILKQNSYR